MEDEMKKFMVTFPRIPNTTPMIIMANFFQYESRMLEPHYIFYSESSRTAPSQICSIPAALHPMILDVEYLVE
jgi:hypothetical protein